MAPVLASPVIWPERLLSVSPPGSRLNSTLPSGVIEPRTVKLPIVLPCGAAPTPQ